MVTNFKNIFIIILPFLFFYGLKYIDYKVDNMFNELVIEEKKKVETNLSNEERASKNINPKIRFILLTPNTENKDYIKYKLKYLVSYVLKEGSPERTFIYYK